MKKSLLTLALAAAFCGAQAQDEVPMYFKKGASWMNMTTAGDPNATARHFDLSGQYTALIFETGSIITAENAKSFRIELESAAPDEVQLNFVNTEGNWETDVVLYTGTENVNGKTVIEGDIQIPGDDKFEGKESRKGYINNITLQHTTANPVDEIVVKKAVIIDAEGKETVMTASGPEILYAGSATFNAQYTAIAVVGANGKVAPTITINANGTFPAGVQFIIRDPELVDNWDGSAKENRPNYFPIPEGETTVSVTPDFEVTGVEIQCTASGDGLPLTLSIASITVKDNASPVPAILNGNATVVGYYNISGTEVSAPVKGINIVKYSDGTVRKIMVK